MEEYLRTSPTHQRTRSRVRWYLPIAMSALMLFSLYRRGLTPRTVAFYGGVSLLWALFYPKRFDARVRKNTLAFYQEGSYSKNFGNYRLELNVDCLVSEGPSGKSELKWPSIERTELTPGYLFIFFAGGSGFPISVDQIGTETAQAAHDLIAEYRNQGTVASV